MKFYIFDIETYSNCFLFTGKYAGEQSIHVFELSDRRFQRDELIRHLNVIRSEQTTYMVGFNSLGFDYPIIHHLMNAPYTFDAAKAHLLANEIIKGQDYGGAGRHTVWMSDRLIPQIDLVKIHHFDNNARRVSLKALQVAMRSESVEDLPFDPKYPLTSEQMDLLIQYNIHDVTETEKFFHLSKDLIDMRFDLLNNGTIQGDVLNFSDVKIGIEYLIKRIGREKCFIKGSNPRQTQRVSVPFKDIILPNTEYMTSEFNQVLNWFKSQTIFMTKNERPSLEIKLGGIPFKFGVGGLHASVESQVFESNEDFVIKDVDVAGMYPAVAVANGFAPEHLGQAFSNAYRQLKEDRKQYPKGSVMNLVIKLANNGAYGNMNNPYSCLYDPKCAFSITINGQLQLLMLVEMVSLIPGVKLIQANTDGITAYVPRKLEALFNAWCKTWEEKTRLVLEFSDFKKMWIRDVNNYLVLKEDGGIKRKGAYWYPIEQSDYHGSSGSNWSKDFSNIASIKAAEMKMIYGWPVESTLRTMTDPFDFMLREKTPKGAVLQINGVDQPKTLRYFVSKNGGPLKKRMKPKGELGSYKRKNGVSDELWNRVINEIPKDTWDERIHTKNKSKHVERVTSIQSGYLVTECNHISRFNWNDLDMEYYKDEANKLVIQ